MQTVEPKKSAKLQYKAEKMNAKMKAANSRNNELIR